MYSLIKTLLMFLSKGRGIRAAADIHRFLMEGDVK